MRWRAGRKCGRPSLSVCVRPCHLVRRATGSAAGRSGVLVLVAFHRRRAAGRALQRRCPAGPVWLCVVQLVAAVRLVAAVVAVVRSVVAVVRLVAAVVAVVRLVAAVVAVVRLVAAVVAAGGAAGWFGSLVRVGWCAGPGLAAWPGLPGRAIGARPGHPSPAGREAACTAGDAGRLPSTRPAGARRDSARLSRAWRSRSAWRRRKPQARCRSCSRRNASCSGEQRRDLDRSRIPAITAGPNNDNCSIR